MSDATFSPPRSSSIPHAGEAEHRSEARPRDVTLETSLVLKNPDNTVHGSQADVEARTENKQKRKRTSPEDQKILEAEYRNNPKPNKAARAEIVEKVTLNEKEVQIWFQNRRQITRRKTRPLQPHELAEFGLRGIEAFSSDPASTAGFSSSSSETDIESKEQTASTQEGNGLSPESKTVTQHPAKVSPQGMQVGELDKERSLPSVSTAEALENSQSNSQDSGTLTSSFSITKSVARSFSSTPGYLSNRWNAIRSSFSTPASSQAGLPGTPPISTTRQPASCPERIGQPSTLKRSASQVRLSMALDGTAQLITSDVSPPRAQQSRPSSSGSSIPQKRMIGLQRSYSALPFVPLPGQLRSASAALVPSLPTGRSRDARAWESACGAEARDELTTQAENESSGSATAAINLIRSTPLQSNPNKRNAPSLSQQSSQSKHVKKPKLARTTSSLARLQTTAEPVFNPFREPLKQSKGGLTRSPSGDSDKENWIPTTGSDNPRRRPLPSARNEKQNNSKAILGENHNVPAHATSFGGARNRRRKQAQTAEPQIFEDQENGQEIPLEVERFMRGEVSPSKKGDLDCIQGLLSLSQGNWR